jgi:hypothetical protein
MGFAALDPSDGSRMPIGREIHRPPRQRLTLKRTREAGRFAFLCRFGSPERLDEYRATKRPKAKSARALALKMLLQFREPERGQY